MSHVISNEEELHWLALSLVPGLGPKKATQLVKHFQCASAIFRSSLPELESLGVPRGLAQSLLSGCTFDDAATQQQTVRSLGVALIPFTDHRYPHRLRHIYDPPPLLYARGRVELLDSVMIGVVGTRRPSAYGSAAATKLSEEMANAGITIASGMAKGIDTSAHKAALAVGGNTVAVFGCGVDHIYPAENRKLAGEIAQKGLVLSEFSVGTPAYPQNFPIRNRIVSGLSAGILVVEGAQYSGSAITARLALEQGRELYAVPGNITSKMSWVPNLLIKQGAKLVQTAEDVLAELLPEDRRRAAACRPHTAASPSQPTLDQGLTSEILRSVAARLTVDQPTHIDTLLEDLPQYSSSELIAALFELEMAGTIRQLAGKHYIKVW